MAERIDNRALREALNRLTAAGVVPAVRQGLEAEADRIAGDIFDVVVEEASAFSESGNPDVLPELKAHLQEHVNEVCRLLGGGLPGDFAFVCSHAERRAAQKFPLDALLQSYRCLHKVLAKWIRDAALDTADENAHVRRVVAAVTDFTIEYTGTVGTLITSEYVRCTRRQAEAEGDQRSELLNTLLEGYDESDQAAARLLRRAGYLQQRQSYCVAIARSVVPKEMENPARAQRMADAIGDVLAPLAIRTIIGIRDQHVVVVMSATRRLSGWTAPQSLLAERVYPALMKVGPAAVIGLSNDAPSTSHIPHALSQARLALDFASVAVRVMPYARISFRQMLLASSRAAAQASLPDWLADFSEADRRARGALSVTLRAYAACDMNVLKTAKRLAMHPNTIYARMQRMQALTKLNPLEFHALGELLLVLDCAGSDSDQR